jgi:hypothetical protein
VGQGKTTPTLIPITMMKMKDEKHFQSNPIVLKYRCMLPPFQSREIWVYWRLTTKIK